VTLTSVAPAQAYTTDGLVLDVDARDTASSDQSNPTVVHDISPTGLTGAVNGNVVDNTTTGAWDFGGGNSGSSNIVITRHAGNANFLVEILNSDNVVLTLITEDNPIVADETAHWAVTIGTDLTLHFYKNGVELRTNIDGTVYSQGAPYAGLPETTTRNHSYIGRSLWGDPEFAGSITYLRVYNRALTPTEITDNIDADSAPDSSANTSGGTSNHRGSSRAQELAATGFNPVPWLVSNASLVVGGIALCRCSTRDVQ
jgi:hypothetical protein